MRPLIPFPPPMASLIGLRPANGHGQAEDCKGLGHMTPNVAFRGNQGERNSQKLLTD